MKIDLIYQNQSLVFGNPTATRTGHRDMKEKVTDPADIGSIAVRQGSVGNGLSSHGEQVVFVYKLPGKTGLFRKQVIQQFSYLNKSAFIFFLHFRQPCRQRR